MRKFLLICLCLAGIPTLSLAAALTPAQQAAQDAAVKKAFSDAQALANGAVPGAAATVTNGTVQSTVNGFNPKYYGYTTTTPESALFMGGNGDTFTPGAAKITSCQTGAANPDKFLQQNCDAISYMAKNPLTRPQFTISPTDPNIAASRTIEKNASALAAKSLGFVDPNAVGSFTGCASKTTTTPPTFGIEVCYDAATATSQMCTIGRTVVVNANTDYQCDKTTNTYQTQTCNRTAAITIPSAIPATQVASCGTGYTLSGANCTAPATASNPNYSCNSGTLSGTQCLQPAYQPAGVAATATSTSCTGYPASTYRGTVVVCLSPCPAGTTAKWVGGSAPHSYCVAAPSCPPGTSGETFYGFFLCKPSTPVVTYSCPSGYTPSGSTCYPPMVTPPPTPATISSYSCPTGSVLSGTTCVPTTSVTVTYTCGAGMTLSGTTCQPDPLMSWQDACSALETLSL